MAYTFLQAVNATLKRNGLIAGDSGSLSSFTDSARQTEIDVTIQVWNEAMHRLYARYAFQGEVKEGTVTLATDTREYAVPSDFERMAGETYETRVMVNTEGHILYEYKGGYLQMYADQPDPSDFTGQPSYWALNLTNNKFRMNTTPQSGENGDAYTFLYEKRISMSATTDTFPFDDTIVDSLMPVVAAVTKLSRNGDVSEEAWAAQGFKDAVKLIAQSKRRSAYGLRYLPAERDVGIATLG